MIRTIPIVGILFILVTSQIAVSTIEVFINDSNRNIKINDFNRLDVPSPSWLKGADQMMINNSKIGMSQGPNATLAQAFKPTKSTLTAVALYYFKVDNPPEETTLTVTIREELDGPELTTVTVVAMDLRIRSQPRGSWILFDFPDIQVIPEQTYYIQEQASHGEPFGNTYCWFMGFNNQYPRGEGWARNYGVFDWQTLSDFFNNDPQYSNPDWCFITYHQEPKYKEFLHPILIFLEHHPHLFPILRTLLEI